MREDKTTTVLIDDLKKLPKTTGIESIIKKAQLLYYHDFASHLATPKIELYKDLKQEGLKELATKVIKGRYD